MFESKELGSFESGLQVGIAQELDTWLASFCFNLEIYPGGVEELCDEKSIGVSGFNIIITRLDVVAFTRIQGEGFWAIKAQPNDPDILHPDSRNERIHSCI